MDYEYYDEYDEFEEQEEIEDIIEDIKERIEELKDTLEELRDVIEEKVDEKEGFGMDGYPISDEEMLERGELEILLREIEEIGIDLDEMEKEVERIEILPMNKQRENILYEIEEHLDSIEDEVEEIEIKIYGFEE